MKHFDKVTNIILRNFLTLDVIRVLGLFPFLYMFALPVFSTVMLMAKAVDFE